MQNLAMLLVKKIGKHRDSCSHAMHDGSHVNFLSRIPIQNPVPTWAFIPILWLRLFPPRFFGFLTQFTVDPYFVSSSIHVIYRRRVPIKKNPVTATQFQSHVSHCPISTAAIKTHKCEVWILPKLENNNNHPSTRHTS